MRTAFIIPIYNRPIYVSRCLASLNKLDTKPDLFILVDDHSTDPEIKQIIGKFVVSNKNTIAYRMPENGGVKKSLLWGIECAISKDVDLFINLDSDAVVTSDFVERLINLHKATQLVCSGFNNPQEPFLPSTLGKWNCIKSHANGINMCFNREQYEKYIKPALLKKTGNWDYMASESAGCVAITVPSCVQHIGMVSSMGHVGADMANDFIPLHLPDVTLFGIDSHDRDGINRAAKISQENIKFGAVNIITKDLFTKNGHAEQRRKDYSKFMIKELHKHFDTSHVLTIHADGYVLNADAWDNEWLQYDYIGATWWYKDGMNVGNGGFSLRSKRLCNILSSYELSGEHYHPEDQHICRTYRPALEALGIKFAPAEIADKFSIEAYGVHAPDNAYSGQFGFHGPHVDMNALAMHGIPEHRQYKKTILSVRNNSIPSRR